MNIWRRQQKGHPLYAAGRPLNANSLPTGRPKAENGNRPVFSNFSIEPLSDDFYGRHAVIWDAGMP